MYVPLHALRGIPQEELYVQLKKDKVQLSKINAGVHCSVADNVLMKVNKEYENALNEIEALPSFRAKNKMIKFCLLTKRDGEFKFDHFEECSDFIDEKDNPKGAHFVYYLAKYHSQDGDSGCIVYGLDSQTCQWHPFGVHFGDQGEHRKISQFFEIPETKNFVYPLK